MTRIFKRTLKNVTVERPVKLSRTKAACCKVQCCKVQCCK